ncbi:UDP-N-acetylenolpyruvoylglucosamine reductase [hydrothermal vent metagenome]|uniref:UDP-N-acetylmuramate dehydrogenase n=1 Tax=hydrothermal vent metagenome TaxID=652676 RepID=A0A1W1CG14_9ZZZZ
MPLLADQGVNVYIKTIDFSRYSSIRIGGLTEVLVIERGDDIPTDRYLIGGANNLLISPTPPPLMVLGREFATIELDGDMLTIGAAMPTGRVVSFAKKHNLSGFEFFAKLPGTLGGMLAMNAGVKSYEIFNILHSVEINGDWIGRDEIEYGYRFAHLGGVATSAKFRVRSGFDSELLETLVALRANQPKEPSAGSAFKNPDGDSAGRLIEAVGLKGHRIGGMAWSEVHANFLVNLGNGNFDEAIELITLAKSRVDKEFDIALIEEIKIL